MNIIHISASIDTLGQFIDSKGVPFDGTRPNHIDELESGDLLKYFNRSYNIPSLFSLYKMFDITPANTEADTIKQISSMRFKLKNATVVYLDSSLSEITSNNLSYRSMSKEYELLIYKLDKLIRDYYDDSRVL